MESSYANQPNILANASKSIKHAEGVISKTISIEFVSRTVSTSQHFSEIGPLTEDQGTRFLGAASTLRLSTIIITGAQHVVGSRLRTVHNYAASKRYHVATLAKREVEWR
jgi:hypothetical protein